MESINELSPVLADLYTVIQATEINLITETLEGVPSATALGRSPQF